MLILVHDAAHGLIARLATPRERLGARLRAGSLDRRLAAGAAAESSPLLAVRALMLVRPSMRESLARSLQQIMTKAAQPDGRRSAALPPLPRAQILNSVDVLTTLIERLNGSAPVAACGVAKVKLLLTDGAGPLYYPSCASDLRAGVQDAINALSSPLHW